MKATTRDMFAAESYITGATAGSSASEKVYQAPIVSVRLVKEATMQMRLQVKSPHDLARDLAARFADCDREHFVAVALDTKNRVIAVDVVAVGTLDAALVNMREAFKTALICGAAAVIFAHNHPSGDPTPSPEDVLTTRNLRDAGRILDIDVLDHLVIGEFGRYTSLRERGLGWS